MINFFDYVFYSACKFYEKYKSEGAPWYGLAVVCLFQGFNVMSIMAAIEILRERKSVMTTFSILAVCFVLLILNFNRYKKLGYVDLAEKWKNEESGKKIRNGLLVILYMVVSFSLVLSLVIYLGNHQDW